MNSLFTKVLRKIDSMTADSVSKENGETEQTQGKIKKLEAYIASTNEAAAYSIQRFDILIISLSSGGLALSITFVKDVITEFVKTDKVLLKWSWILFGASLIINLLSQMTGYLDNKYSVKVAEDRIRALKKLAAKGKPSRKVWFRSFYNVLTNLFNLVSLLSLIAAVVLLTLFILKYVK